MRTAFRISVTAAAVFATAQAIIAGNFLSGHYGALVWHNLTAGLLIVAALLSAVLALVRRPPRPILIGALLLPVFVAAQAALGMFRVLTLHVPIGVLMIVGSWRLAAWAWRPEPVPATTTGAAVVS